ncbi:MAG: pseudouridine synthase [Chlorobi bacterium OLB7]|nr:MAG: pseudouridine synthase [Chlorobi bacterium OLB7]
MNGGAFGKGRNLHGTLDLWLHRNSPHSPYFCCKMKRHAGRYRSPFHLPKKPKAEKVSTLFLPNSGRTYIAFNKPYNVVSQFTPPHDGAQTLAEFGFPPDVYPVGRLDQDSEGLLLLTNDATLNQALLHPSRHHTKSYLVQVEGIPDDEALRQLAEGVVVQGKRTLPATACRIEPPAIEHRAVRYRATIPTSWMRPDDYRGAQPPSPPDDRRRWPPHATAVPRVHRQTKPSASSAARGAMAEPHNRRT